jgi:glycosyltransferase involved in cell wall biosynthesis
MGAHSGYDQLCEALSDVPGLRAASLWREEATPETPEETRFLRRIRSLAGGSEFYDSSSAASEEEAFRLLGGEPRLVHVLYGENNLGLLRNVRYGSKLLVTVHQSKAWWTEPVPPSVPRWGARGAYDVREFFRGVDALVVLSREDAEFFRSEADVPVRYIPHGVDVEFFRPASDADRHATAGREEPVCLTVGHWQRDFETLDHAISVLGESHRNIRFELVVPDCGPHPQASALERLRARPNVRWAGRLSDEELRSAYQRANLLLLPLVASGANNALLEALAAGLPIVSTDTGGTPDYTRPECAELTAPADGEAMAAAVRLVLSSVDRQITMGREARSLAISEYSWSRIAEETLDMYREVSLA